MQSTLVTKIVRDSIVDGPGCRYVIFMKGCHLRCQWCHNPETQLQEEQIIFYEQFCIQCRRCAQTLSPADRKDFNPAILKGKTDQKYFEVVKQCPTNALSFTARFYTTNWLLEDIKKYQTVYQATGGGLTLSGGEPLLKPDFCEDLLVKAKKEKIHTAVDTCGAVDWQVISRLSPLVDLWLYDFKHYADPQVMTELNICNLEKLDHNQARLWIRIPLIPDYNCQTPVLEKMARQLVDKQSIEHIFLLPFHPYAQSKYRALGRIYQYTDLSLDHELEKKAAAVFKNYFDESKISLGKLILAG